MPPFGKIRSQSRHFWTGSGAAKSLEMIGFRTFSGALDIAPAGLAQGGAPRCERFTRDGKARPLPGESALRQRSVMSLQFGRLAQGYQQIEGGVLAHVIQQFDGKMFDIRNEQRSWLRAGQNL